MKKNIFTVLDTNLCSMLYRWHCRVLHSIGSYDLMGKILSLRIVSEFLLVIVNRKIIWLRNYLGINSSKFPMLFVNCQKKSLKIPNKVHNIFHILPSEFIKEADGSGIFQVSIPYLYLQGYFSPSGKIGNNWRHKQRKLTVFDIQRQRIDPNCFLMRITLGK